MFYYQANFIGTFYLGLYDHFSLTCNNLLLTSLLKFSSIQRQKIDRPCKVTCISPARHLFGVFFFSHTPGFALAAEKAIVLLTSCPCCPQLFHASVRAFWSTWPTWTKHQTPQYARTHSPVKSTPPMTSSSTTGYKAETQRYSKLDRARNQLELTQLASQRETV